ncbi:TRAP transporter small permease [Stappia sp. BW2]|uniref:TRAP transporter small permease n=1 Tax=Stappia sp. BW2 TaxID=2592622 RepID=UPI0011DE660A|nr:TRAP transporter small permease subunit [Stappia sp. BW2]TYC64758.1 TRAP transporter small permease [Stappia sp. BW2]
MNHVTRISGIIFGTVMIALSITIVAEILLRKFFSFSLGGVDELGGYTVAIVAPLTFLVAAADSAHIRINLLHARLPERPQAMLNVAAAVSLTLLSLFLLYFTVQTVVDTLAYNSIAQTPWATPLIYPQTLWLLTMGVFAIGMFVLSLQAIVMLVKRDWRTLNLRFGPESVSDEVLAELEDLKKRQGAAT